MSDDNKFSDNDKSSRKGGEFKVPPRTWIIWIAIFGGIITLMLLRERMDAPGQILSQYEFLRKVESNQIAQATINYSPQSPLLTEIVGKYYLVDPETGNRVKKNGEDQVVAFRTKARLTESMENKLFNLPQFEPREPNTMLLTAVWSILPILVIAVLIWFFFIRQIKMAGKGALSFGKSKARLLAKERNKTTFKDVAG